MIDWTQLYPAFAKQLADFLELCTSKGLRIEGTEGYRSPQRQAELYDRHDGTTNARPGMSPHQWGCAVDFIFVNEDGTRTYDGDWTEFGSLAERAGLVWGGTFRSDDKDHVEFAHWRQVRAANWRPPQKDQS
jgi:peptidoglycan L-alanyl-D-glutamate endopeptidase CwlK